MIFFHDKSGTILFTDNATTPSLQISNQYISQKLTSAHSIAMISFAYELGCSLYYYGSDCSVYCSPVNDDAGHYTCDYYGTKVCLPGYSDPTNNCLMAQNSKLLISVYNLL